MVRTRFVLIAAVALFLLFVEAGFAVVLLVSFFPDHFFSIAVATPVVLIVCITMIVVLVQRRRLRSVFLCLLTLCGLLILSGYGLNHHLNERENLPNISTRFFTGEDEPATGFVVSGARDGGEQWHSLFGHFRDRNFLLADGWLDPLLSKPLTARYAAASLEQQRATADRFFQSKFQFMDYPPAQLSEKLLWTEDPYGDRTWNWHLHCMSYVSLLAHAYKETGEVRYLEKAREFVLKWIEDNSRYFIRPVSDFSWHDHATAFRLMNWLYFWDIWIKSPLATEAESHLIFRSMLAHAMRLASDDFYTLRHNHGIDQDYALIAFTLLFPELASSHEWQEIALDRLEDQLHFAVSPNGIHLEHSPNYHLYGMTQFQDVHALLEAGVINHPISEKLSLAIESMAGFVKHLVQPDGNILRLGDTPIVGIQDYARELSAISQSNSELKCLLDSGTLCENVNEAAVYLDEGYVVIRDFDDGRLPFEKSVYIFFTTSANPGRSHKHADDLSFILSYNGQDLLIDPGIYSYKRDSSRGHVVSSQAHNTVLIDDKGFRGWKSRLKKFIQTDELVALLAYHDNYERFRHLRWLVFLRPSLVFVIDSLEPFEENIASSREQEHNFVQLFQSARDIEVKTLDLSEEVWFVPRDVRDSVPLMRILQLGSDETSTRIASGEADPLMLGWDSPEYGILEPAPVATFRIEGSEATFVTAIELNMKPEERSGEFFERSEFTANLDEGRVSISWLEKGVRRELTIDRSAQEVEVSPYRFPLE